MTNTAFNVSFSAPVNFTASFPPAQRIVIGNSTNPYYLRYAMLTQDSLQIVYYTASATIPLNSLYQAAFFSNPILSAPPFILGQPTSSTVTAPAPFYFVVSASSETPPLYQWYWQSQSLSVYSPCPTSFFSGTSSAALTCSVSTASTENSASYFCTVTNTTGQVSSSIVISYVL